MRIAIIGTGISGLSCAYLIQDLHEITVFESASKVGGHTATIDILHNNQPYRVDTGFIVYNDWTYPNFIKLMDELNVRSKATEMSFSVSCEQTGLEYGGNNLDTLFAQRKNLWNLPYLGMLKDILRFNKEAILDLESGALDPNLTLGQYLQQRGYGKMFASHYLIPMGSAIWSSTRQEMLDFPLIFFVRFFKNHGLLSVNNRPQWRVIEGGSSAYLMPLTSRYRERIRTNAKIVSVKRVIKGVELLFANGEVQEFDQVVFACHSDQALALLGDDAHDDEKAILGALPYRNNDVVLHTDERLLPKTKKAWSSWNYLLGDDSQVPATLSYNMNILQGFNCETPFIVTLNATDRIEPSKILGQFNYAHPVFTLEGIEAQQNWHKINGVRDTWFCGAYWRNGFHEDGCVSGVRVAQALGSNWQG